MLVGKAARDGHFCQGRAGVAHQSLRSSHPLEKQKLVRRLAGALTKAANKVRCAETRLARKLTQPNVFSQGSPL